MAQSIGNGLQGTYFPGCHLARTALPADNTGSPTASGRSPPSITSGTTSNAAGYPGLTVGDSFAARFEGQIVPPISGDYTFSLDTDGDARVLVRSTATRRRRDIGQPRQLTLPRTQCSHDICVDRRADQHVVRRRTTSARRRSARTDPACCTQTWDARCVDEVNDVLRRQHICTPTAGCHQTLNAGWKYDIRVEYHHQGSTAGRAGARRPSSS